MLGCYGTSESYKTKMIRYHHMHCKLLTLLLSRMVAIANPYYSHIHMTLVSATLNSRTSALCNPSSRPRKSTANSSSGQAYALSTPVASGMKSSSPSSRVSKHHPS